MWMKLQVPGDPEQEQPASPMLEARFGGTTEIQYEPSFSVPFRLSERSQHIHNWEEVKDSLPLAWDDHEFLLSESPYAWCETLSEGCDCHSAKGRLDITCCSNFGLLEDAKGRQGRSHNAWHRNYIRGLEQRITNHDQARRQENSGRATTLPSQEVAPVEPTSGVPLTADEMAAARADAINRVNRLMAQTYYCQIEGRYHACSAQVRLRLVAKVIETVEQLTRLHAAARRTLMTSMDAVIDHFLRRLQSDECAEKVVRGKPDVPQILYKYIPRHLIGSGAPNSLRATQLRALNDDMECSVRTMNTDTQMDALQFLALVQSKLGEQLGITPEWEDLLTRSLRYGDLRLSTFIQDYLTPHVGVVSLSTDPLVPTMWSHYSRNTGIVVGYDSEMLQDLGFALRPMLYSEIAPSYQPAKDDTIRLDFLDRERLQEQTRQGESPNSFTLIATSDLAEMSAGWRSLSPLLFVKGMSWAYEKEVRLLVDLDNTRDTGKKDASCWPIKVIDLPPDAVKEIHRGDNTRDADVDRAVEVARGDNNKGLLVQSVSAHAFRIQRTVGSRY